MINLETFLNLQMCEEVILSNTSTVLNMAINTMQISNFLWHKDFHSMISFRDFEPLGLHKMNYIQYFLQMNSVTAWQKTIKKNFHESIFIKSCGFSSPRMIHNF